MSVPLTPWRATMRSLIRRARSEVVVTTAVTYCSLKPPAMSPPIIVTMKRVLAGKDSWLTSCPASPPPGPCTANCTPIFFLPYSHQITLRDTSEVPPADIGSGRTAHRGPTVRYRVRRSTGVGLGDGAHRIGSEGETGDHRERVAPRHQVYRAVEQFDTQEGGAQAGSADPGADNLLIVGSCRRGEAEDVLSFQNHRSIVQGVGAEPGP